MGKTVLLVTLLLLPAPAVAHGSQVAACKPEPLQADSANPIPEGFSVADKVMLITAEGNPVAGEVPISKVNRTSSVNGAVLALSEDLRVQLSTDGVPCVQTPGAAAKPRLAASSQIAIECVRAGALATSELRKVYGRREEFVVLILSDGGTCYASKHFSTEGDFLFIGYIRDVATNIGATIEFDKCDAASAIPKVLASDISGIKPEALAAPKIEVQWFLPVAQCFGNSVEFHLDKPDSKKFVSGHITQYERYRATLQLGTLWSKRHIESFGLRAEGDTKVLASKGPAATAAPEYIAAVVIYGLPQYFQRRDVKDPSFLPGSAVSPTRRIPYFGREPIHENGFADRLGLLFGVGLSQPGRRFVSGVAFEIINGVNVMGAYEFTRLIKLNGYEVGQEFAGTAEQILLKDEWDRGWAFGIAIDGRYATALFGKK